MIRNYLKTAIRNLYKQRYFTLINVIGLALGMACCFSIVLYLQHELSYDQFFENKDRIFRVNYRIALGGSDVTIAAVPPPMGPKLPEYFPEVEHSARAYTREVSVKVPKNQVELELDDAYFVDSTFLDIFTLDFLAGDPQKALDPPFSMVLTDKTAKQLFGRLDVEGETVELAGVPFFVNGVIKDLPANAHFHFSFLVPYNNMFDLESEVSREKIQQNFQKNWVASHSMTYVLLKPGQLAENVNAKFKDFIQEFGHEQIRDKQSFSLVPITDIHLYSEAGMEPEPPANLMYLYIFLAIGIITLLIACINFINLSTAGSLGRAKEVGVRKVLGAGSRRIITQFIGESMLVSFIAFLMALIIVDLTLPYLNKLTDTTILFDPFKDLSLLALFIGIFFLTGLLAGTYPSLLASRFNPVTILKGSGANSVNPSAPLRRILIAVQFFAAILLIGCTLTIFTQFQYLQQQSVGFQKDQILSVPLFSESMNNGFRAGDAQLRQKMNAFEEEVLKDANVEAITASSDLPGFGAVNRGVSSEHVPKEESLFLPILSVDYDFVETYQLEMLAGRDFDKSFGTDHLKSFVINEQAVSVFKWDSPEQALGKEINLEGKVGQVVGVVRDFNFQNLRQSIEGMIMEVRPAAFTYFSVRVNPQDISGTIEHIAAQWDGFFPEKVFEYDFLDASLARLYANEQRLTRIIGYFAFLAILISCIGLLGLAALAIKQRTKEIGIRKVLGASVSQIIQLIANDFVRIVLVAMVLAIPVGWYLMNRWLSEFAYRIPVPWYLLVLAGVLALGIAFLTISMQSMRSARANPVDSLRHE